MRSTLIVLALFSFVTSQTSSSASASSTGQLSDCASMCMNAALSMGPSSCSSIFSSCLSNQGCPDQISTISSVISQRCGTATGASTPAIGVNSNSNSNMNSNSGPLTSMNSATGNDPNIPFGLPGSVLNSNNNGNTNIGNTNIGNTNSNNNNNGGSNSNQPSNSNNINSNANTNNNGNNMNAPSLTPPPNPLTNTINPFGLVQTAGIVNINTRPTATNAPPSSVIANDGWLSVMNTSIPTSNSPFMKSSILVVLIPLFLSL